MNDLAQQRTTIRSYEDRYLRFRTKAGFAFRSEIGGVIPNGWTTIEQAEWMASVAAISDDDLLLDIGAGRGWPGSLIAKETGAKLVSVDVPLEALRQGAKDLCETLGPRVLQVCGDGRVLPIGDSHFSAVCQADVLCWVLEELSVLRECRRVLKRDGRLVAVTIEIAEGLGAAERDQATELGPEDLGTGGPLRDLVAQSGFEVVIERDLTEDFRVSLLDRLNALDQNDAELRRAEGHEMVDTEREKRTNMLTAVQEGLLRRTALVGRAWWLAKVEARLLQWQ